MSPFADLNSSMFVPPKRLYSSKNVPKLPFHSQFRLPLRLCGFSLSIIQKSSKWHLCSGATFQTIPFRTRVRARVCVCALLNMLVQEGSREVRKIPRVQYIYSAAPPLRHPSNIPIIAPYCSRPANDEVYGTICLKNTVIAETMTMTFYLLVFLVQASVFSEIVFCASLFALSMASAGQSHWSIAWFGAKFMHGHF